MPIEIHEDSSSQIIVIHASGKLERSDYNSFIMEFEQLVNRHGKIRVLFDMTGFEGWSPGALWKEIKFDAKHCGDIERLAAVGQKDWERALTNLAKPFTKTAIRSFPQNEMAAARDWLLKS